MTKTRPRHRPIARLRTLVRNVALVAAGIGAAGAVVAAAWGAPCLAAMGGGGAGCAVATALLTARPARGRTAVALALLGLGLAAVAPFVLPLSTTPGTGPVVSRSVFSADATPWFARLPERDLAVVGARLGLTGPERASWWSVDPSGAGPYAHLTPELVLEATESRVLDGWLWDRGHYWLAVPPESADPMAQRPKDRHAAPLLVFLHGHGGNFAYYPATIAARARERGLAVVFPTWGFGNWWLGDALQRIEAVVAHAARDHKIDTDRIALMGLSAGGLGALRLAAAAPGQFRCAITISGAARDDLDPMALAATPLVLLHGDRDARLPVDDVAALAAAVEQRGGNVELRRIADGDHLALLTHTETVLDVALDRVVAFCRR
ncbi:MAG: prolyl oligopeptidase family serine peptidase [Planctomycetota bacterium]